MVAILKIFRPSCVMYGTIRGFSRISPQYPVSPLSNSLVQADAKLPISEVSNADSVPRQSPGTCLFDRVRFLSRRSFIRGHFLSFSSWTVYVREERPLWQSRMDGCTKRLRSLVYVFPLGWLARVFRVFVTSRRAARVSNPLQRKPQRRNGQYRLMMWSNCSRRTCRDELRQTGTRLSCS